jgi:hypothetical protein
MGISPLIQLTQATAPSSVSLNLTKAQTSACRIIRINGKPCLVTITEGEKFHATTNEHWEKIAHATQKLFHASSTANGFSSLSSFLEEKVILPINSLAKIEVEENGKTIYFPNQHALTGAHPTEEFKHDHLKDLEQSVKKTSSSYFKVQNKEEANQRIEELTEKKEKLLPHLKQISYNLETPLSQDSIQILEREISQKFDIEIKSEQSIDQLPESIHQKTLFKIRGSNSCLFYIFVDPTQPLALVFSKEGSPLSKEKELIKKIQKLNGKHLRIEYNKKPLSLGSREHLAFLLSCAKGQKKHPFNQKENSLELSREILQSFANEQLCQIESEQERLKTLGIAEVFHDAQG